MNLKPSNILDVLGPDLFVPFRAVTIPGKVIWCNFELARELGFDVPESNQMSPELHEQLTSAFSVRALQPKEDRGQCPTLTLYADKYGGDGVAPCLGSARAGFFPYCNAFIKGVGFTPLFRHDNPDDFEHSHGGLNMDQAFTEAVFGEVNLNLFDKESPRILVIIDQGDSTFYPKHDRYNPGKIFPRAIAVRVGRQLRPGHLLAKKCWDHRSRMEVFQAMTRDSGHLITIKKGAAGKEVADVRSTMLRMIDDQALTAAQQIRWRMSHLNLSSSNMDLDGSLLDLATQRSHPRLPCIHPDHSLLNNETTPYPDYADRTGRIITLYGALRRSIPKNKQTLLNAGPINIRKEMDGAYHRHLQRQLLCAAGLKTKVADCILMKDGVVAERFAEILTKMTQIKNRANAKRNRGKIFEVAALDVFHLLAVYPERYFANPMRRNVSFVQKALRPIYKGSDSRVAKKRSAAGKLALQFCSAYHHLMEAVRSRAMEHYGDATSMQTSIKSRAAFENRVTGLLFRKTYCDAFDSAIAAWRSTGNLSPIREVTNGRISASLRNVDRLLCQGQSRPLPDEGLELQIRVIDGIRCSVRAWNDPEQERCLHVSAPVERALRSCPSSSGPDPGNIQLRATLRYRFTTKGWASSSDVPVCVDWDPQQGTLVAHAVIETPCLYGELQGYFFDAERDTGHTQTRQENSCLEVRYAFAMPDRIEFMEIAEMCGRPGT